MHILSEKGKTPLIPERVGVEGKTGIVFLVGNRLRNQAQEFIYALPSEVPITYSSKPGGEQKWHIYQNKYALNMNNLEIFHHTPRCTNNLIFTFLTLIFCLKAY